MTKRRLYILSTVGCMVGYIWLLLSAAFSGSGLGTSCLFKRFFHIPCPSCGSTRAILALMQGQIKESFLLNPNGLLLVMLLVGIPLWMLVDGIWKKDSYYVFYKRTDELFRRKYIFLLFACLIVTNWIWNITKGL